RNLSKSNNKREKTARQMTAEDTGLSRQTLDRMDLIEDKGTEEEKIIAYCKKTVSYQRVKNGRKQREKGDH
ncbi:MAG: hypothetical protein ACRD4B_01970, partial [Acidobacteriota bacterium]